MPGGPIKIETDDQKKAVVYAQALKGLTEKQVNFVTNIINGMTAYQSYCASGYKCSNYNIALNRSRDLYDNKRIQLALGTIRRAETKDHEITRDRLVEMFLEHREKALAKNNIGPANSAVMGIAKVLGLDIHTQKSEVKHTYEVEQATQDLYKMLRTRGKAKRIEMQAEEEPLDATPKTNVDTPVEIEDAEIVEDETDETDG